MAEAVAPSGTVYAVDIQEPMLAMLATRAQKQGITNINTIVGGLLDPRLPEGELDLVLLVDVYHEFSHPEHMLHAIRRSLRPNGRMVLVEFRAEDSEVPIKRDHKMSKTQVLKEIPPNGFRLVREFDALPWQHMMFFEPDGAPE
jgi:ubiquinone/menaquinone biosynthesis C-methylase UbiE